MLNHIPVLRREVIEYLAPKSNQNFVDATVGFGGHAGEILQRTGPEGKLLAVDQDRIALEEAKKNLDKYGKRVQFQNRNFDDLGLIIRGWPVSKISGILFDLGTSMYQLVSDRGFSFRIDAPLDMRMSAYAKLNAAKIVNEFPESKIREMLLKYGEEPFAGKIAKEILDWRRKKRIESTGELVKIIEKAIPQSQIAKRKIHFATLTFLGLRIAVNDELNVLENGLKQAVQILSPGGRIVIISFHSLEDRIVKHALRDSEELEVLTSRPVVPSQSEVSVNPSSRSAKLRAAVKK